jgi:SAM-dependent methyltransferase
MLPGRNDDCWCGSRRKYKHCHHQIDLAADDKKYAASQAVYARNWKVTSQHHYEAGLYQWLAAQLADHAPKRILDIGCGSGHGLVALRATLGDDVRIVAIDENRACLQAADETLRQHGITTQVVHRMTVAHSANGYDHVAGPLTFDEAAECVLIEADVCNDAYLAAALQTSGPFDAVTVWLTGVHMMRQFNVNVRAQGVTTDGAHRLYVQNSSYELADAVLRSGGVLQIGDRGQAPDTPLLREDALQAHREQASVTSLDVKGLAFRPYEEPDHRRTPMRFTPGTAGLVPQVLKLAVVSVVSEKP